jgi:hypothetical protein
MSNPVYDQIASFYWAIMEFFVISENCKNLLIRPMKLGDEPMSLDYI